MARAFRRLLSSTPFCAGASVVACSTSQPRPSLEEELAKLRPGEAALRAKWISDDAESWKRLPPRAWPPYQPLASDVPDLRALIEAERCPPAGSAMSSACTKAHFNLATALVFNSLDSDAGLSTYRALAKAGDLDGMTATGVCLVEEPGGVKQDYSEGLQWIEKASGLGSAQAQFELGTILYVGMAGLEEDEEAALALFRKGAEQRHSSSMFMVADCMLEGTACQQDKAGAVPLLLEAANMGHRGARQHLRQLLDGQWRGFEDQNSAPDPETSFGNDLPSRR